MLFWKTFDIAENQKALLYRRNRFERVLGPGRRLISTIGGKLSLTPYDISKITFSHPQTKFLLKNNSEKLTEDLEYFEMGDDQVGLMYRDEHLYDILTPGSFTAVWKGVEAIRVQIIDISKTFDVDDKMLAGISHSAKPTLSEAAANAIYHVEISDENVGLLVVNGKLDRLLEPGRYGFWSFNRSISVKQLDLRLQMIDISGQEILTKDRVSLRINLSAAYRIIDPKITFLKLSDATNLVYRELQLALREAVSAETLDTLLEDKNILNGVISKDARAKLANFGIELSSVGVKDVILPGEMKLILNQVVEAQKQAEANLIKRREETQAMRSLHNTAKLMDNNPMLLRLKELESLENITERIDKISVYGGLDSVMNNLIKLGR